LQGAGESVDVNLPWSSSTLGCDWGLVSYPTWRGWRRRTLSRRCARGCMASSWT
jgi:hypothetical protein